MGRRMVSALVTLALLAGAFVVFRSASGDGDTYRVTADVEQAPNLFAGARVMVRGVDVGVVSEVEPTPSGVRLSMDIREDVKVPSDATLSVIPVTVISDRYVQFFPAYEGGPTLEDGDHLALERTTIPAELDEVLTQLQGLLEALEPAEGEKRGSLARLIRSLDKAFSGRSSELAGAIEGSATVLENLADSDRDLTGIIQNLDRVFLALANRSSEIAIVNERFQLVTEALLLDQGNLEGTIENIAFLSDETASLLEDSGEDVGRSFGRLSKVLRTLLKHQGSLKQGIQWANVIAQSLGETDRSGKGLYAYSGRQAEPGTEGAEYNYRIDSRDTITCERLNKVAYTVLVVTPMATLDDVLSTALSYIPDEYDDDLAFLIRLLLIDCVDWPTGSPPGLAATQTLQELEQELGQERFLRFVARWLAEGYTGETP